MKLPPRRLTFQLVSLFDLLIIIVFAQYFALQDKTRQQLAAATEEAHRLSPEATALERELARQTAAHEALEAEAARRQLELSEELKRSRDDLARLAALTAELFDLPAESLEKLLRSRAPDEAERIRKTLKMLAANRTSEAVRHILTLAELEKRCDIWQVHIRDDGVFDFKADDRRGRFRADTSERFASELFKQYKGLPQPKSLVLILLSWGDAELKSRAAATGGLEIAADRMRTDSDRRSRFEYAILGYIPTAD